MEEKAIFAIILSILILAVYQFLFAPKNINKMNNTIENEKETIVEVGKKDQEIKKESIKKEFNKEINGFLEKKKAFGRKVTSIETEKYFISLDNLGGKIKSLKLKDYYEQKEYESSFLKKELWINVKNTYFNFFKKQENVKKEYVELINSSKTGDNNLSIGYFDRENNLFTDNNDFYIFEKISENEKTIIKFHQINLDGIYIEKELCFYKDLYNMDVKIRIRDIFGKGLKEKFFLLMGPYLGKTKSKIERHKFSGPVVSINGKKKRIKNKEIDVIKKEHNVNWIAIENTYFTSIILPKEKDPYCLMYKDPEDNNISIGLAYNSNNKKFSEEIVYNYNLYIGPKSKEELSKADISLVKIIDYGWFSFFAEILIIILNMIYKIVPNYGIAIILLTIIIKVIFWPLTEKSFNSMKEMQKIQPKMNEIREKFKDDPTKMNKEIIDLYKEYGINPLGGCLPMLLQLPIFIALYEGLLLAIEIRGAPFMFWIKDLSVMDTTLILQILTGITMYYQQKMMPTNIDTKHAKLMNKLPLIFTILFIGFPSGLLLYWLFNNILTIIHQSLIHKK